MKQRIGKINEKRFLLFSSFQQLNAGSNQLKNALDKINMNCVNFTKRFGKFKSQEMLECFNIILPKLLVKFTQFMFILSKSLFSPFEPALNCWLDENRKYRF